MRLRTRTFAICFLPVAGLLSLSFVAVHYFVQSTVRKGLRASLRDSQKAITSARQKSELQNSRFLRIAGENASLKAGLQLMLAEPANATARATVEDQLCDLGERMGFDFISVRESGGDVTAAVLRSGGRLAPFSGRGAQIPAAGLVSIGERVLQFASVPLDQGEENLGLLTIGQYFALDEFSTPAVLMRGGKVLQVKIPGIARAEAASVLASCAAGSECDVRLGGSMWISARVEGTALGDGYEIRSLQNVDAEAGPVEAVVGKVFLIAFGGAMLLAAIGSVVSANSIAGPFAAVVSALRKAESTGVLPEFAYNAGGVREVRELTAAFDRAATALRDSRDQLHAAYLEFVGSLASALDARDRYTAGHSGRVSDLSCSIAASLGMSRQDVDRVRVGALLHDIGKIGVEDRVLQKPGRLTEEEFGLVKLHPEIGRRILGEVHGFAPYLDAVEFHHENWDGTGYPRGLSGKAVPVEARIIHVADAYDAMTTDRPYRHGLCHEDAMTIIAKYAGTQFDPEIAEAFRRLHVDLVRPREEVAQPC